jgi:hypothetical protein
VTLTAAETSYYLDPIYISNLEWIINGVTIPPTIIGEPYYEPFPGQGYWFSGGLGYWLSGNPGPVQCNFCWVGPVMSIYVPENTTSMTVTGCFGNCPANGNTEAGVNLYLNISCTVPTIISVSPSTWFAGKTYDNVVIKGTGFTTADKATAYCPVTPVTITAADGSVVPVSGVTIDSKTKITLTGVAPPASDPTESATVTLGTNPNTATTTGNILGNQIQWTQNGTTSTISTTDGSQPPVQEAVVGQPINLTTPMLPSGLTATSTTWTVEGTNIGGYVVAADASSASVTKTELKNATLDTYWVYTGSAIPVTYKYCVDIPGADADGKCSLVANASFNVSGPTATITPTPNSWSVTNPFTGCNNVQFLVFGVLFPNSTSCAKTPFVPGITFAAALSNVPDSGGTTEWVQLITKNTLSGTLLSGGQAGPTSYGVGLDNSYPYPPDDSNNTVTTLASDTPNNDLGPSLARETRRFKADMYYLWRPQITGSIFVPLGYVDWSVYGTAVQHTTYSPPWSLASSGPTTAAFNVSTDTGNAHGYPTWSGTVVNGQSNTDQKDEELEEQQ